MLRKSPRLVDPVVVHRIDDHLAEVEGTGADSLGGRNLFPGRARIVGAVESGGLGLDGRVDRARTRGGNRHRDASELSFGHAIGDLTPGLATIGRAVETAPRPTRSEEIGRAPELPHRRVENARLLGIEIDVRAARVLIDLEDRLPGLPAIGRLVKTALLIGVPEMAGGAHVDGVAIGRIDPDRADPLGILQSP